MQKGTQGLKIKQGDDKNTGDWYRQKGDRCIGTESVQATGQTPNLVVWLQTHHQEKESGKTETSKEVRVRINLGQTGQKVKIDKYKDGVMTIIQLKEYDRYINKATTAKGRQKEGVVKLDGIDPRAAIQLITMVAIT